MKESKKKLKLGIVGHGFVGKATDWGFNKNVEKFIVDPLLGTDITDLKNFSPEITFVCVPTPMGDDGSQDSSIIESVVTELQKYVPNTVVCIKSTVIPTVLAKLEDLNENIIYNPEFLREKHANKDFEMAEMLIFGGKRNISEYISKTYLENSRCKTKNHIFVELITASLIKYSINTFLATKVIFFNEIFSIFKNINSVDSWEQITSAISLDARIGGSHMDVPGHDGRMGFGGACFPKDSLALIKYAKEHKIDLSVLTATVKKNNQIRKKYKDLDGREKDQNVTFDDKI